MDTKEQLLRLVRLQQVVLETRQAREVVENSPMRIEEAEERFRERNAEYVAVKERYDALDADQRQRNHELAELEEHRDKFAEDRKRVQNEREYSAILKEIDAVAARIAEHEDAILLDMEEIETVKGELQTHEEHIKNERVIVERESAEVKAAEQAARARIEELEAERKSIETDLPPNLVQTVLRLEAGRQGKFLAEAEDGVCQSCFVRVRPQVFQEIKLAVKIHACGNCRRLLHHAASVRQLTGGSETSGSPASDSGTVEALNGGAV